jgi:hypothetical protein
LFRFQNLNVSCGRGKLYRVESQSAQVLKRLTIVLDDPRKKWLLIKLQDSGIAANPGRRAIVNILQGDLPQGWVLIQGVLVQGTPNHR